VLISPLLSNLDKKFLAPKNKIDMIFGDLLYCVENLTNQVGTQLSDWLRRSSFNILARWVEEEYIAYYYYKIITCLEELVLCPQFWVKSGWFISAIARLGCDHHWFCLDGVINYYWLRFLYRKRRLKQRRNLLLIYYSNPSKHLRSVHADRNR